jgi:DNA-directed RNA polymerase specialized sigma54-like protein
MLSSPSLDLTPQQHMLPTAALVAYAALLALPGAELEQAVTAELDDNPALVMDEVTTCATCGMPGGMRCADCGERARRAGHTETGRSPEGAGVRNLATRTSWPEIVLTDLRLLLPARDATIAAAVVASLDDRGYLTEAASAVAAVAGADVTSVERAVRTLRETGPAGVGARDLESPDQVNRTKVLNWRG